MQLPKAPQSFFNSPDLHLPVSNFLRERFACSPLHRIGVTRGFWMVLMGSLCIACTAQPQVTILGQWQGSDRTDGTLEFFQDGAVTLSNNFDPTAAVLKGSYKFLDDHLIQMQLAGSETSTGPLVLEVELSDRELVLTFPEHQIARYERAR